MTPELSVLSYLKDNNIKYNKMISYLTSGVRIPNKVSSELDKHFVLFYVIATGRPIVINNDTLDFVYVYEPSLDKLEYDNLRKWYTGDLPKNDLKNIKVLKNGYTKANISDIHLLFGSCNQRLLKYIQYHRSLSYSDSRNRLTMFSEKLPPSAFHHTLVISSSVLAVVGVTPSRDVDAYIYNSHDDESLTDLWKSMKDSEHFDVKIYHKKHWERSYQKDYYLSNWVDREWPQMVGATNFTDMLYNPSNYFCFNNLKYVSLEATIARIQKRTRWTSYVDLLGIQRVLSIQIDIPCIPRVRMARGSITIIDQQEIDKMYQKIKQYAREWYNIRLNHNEISRIVKSCAYSRYSNTTLNHNMFRNLKDFHKSIKRDYVKRYGTNANFLIDIGSGRLHSLPFWQEANVKHVLAIEPSSDSVEKARRILKKFISKKKSKVHIQLQHSSGSFPWNTEKKQADIVTFEFSFHYLIDNIDIIFRNLKQHCRKGAYVVIHTMDGKLVNWFTQRGPYIVKKGKDVVFRLSKTGDHSVSVFMKSIYGLDHEIDEGIVIVNDLVKAFEDNGFNLIEYVKFLENPMAADYEFEEYELKVSQMYISLVFQKK